MEEPKFKVRTVDFEEKSLQELETELVEGHEKSITEEKTEVIEDKIEDNVEQTSTTEFSIDDDTVLSHIRTKYNKEVNSIDDLFQEKVIQEELEEDVAAFRKYKRETGRGIEDFVRLNKDFDSMDPERLLADFYKENGDDDEDVEYKLSKLNFDEDYDSDQDIKEKKLAKKQELKKAKKYFNDLKEQYKVPLESRESFVPQDEKEEFESFKAYKSNESKALEEQQKKSEYFRQKTEELFSSNFEGFGFNIDDNTKVVYKPGEANDILAQQSNLNNFISKFLDENGYLKNAEMFHKAIALAMDPEKTAKFFYEKGKADAVTNFDKESKNIDMTRNSTTITPKSGFQVRAIEDGYDGRLKIKKR
jgi:hypothetical protein